MHQANQREFLAALDPAVGGLAVDGELGVLAHERGGGLPGRRWTQTRNQSDVRCW